MTVVFAVYFSFTCWFSIVCDTTVCHYWYLHFVSQCTHIFMICLYKYYSVPDSITHYTGLQGWI